MVGTGRFELPTPRTPSECSTRLSHVPTYSRGLPPQSTTATARRLQRAATGMLGLRAHPARAHPARKGTGSVP